MSEKAAKKSLVSKLADVMADVQRVAKRGHNNFHNYDYATESDIVETVRAKLAEQHVMLIPEVVNMHREPVGEKGVVLTTLTMKFTFMDGESGDTIERYWLGSGTDKEDKGVYKAMTGGEKYFLLKTFLMPTGDDPERDDKAPVRGMTVQAPPIGVVDKNAFLGSKGEELYQKPVNDIADRVAADVMRGYASAQNTKPTLPGNPLRIERIDSSPTKNENVTKYRIVLSSGEEVTTIKQQLAHLCEQLCQENVPIAVETKSTKWGTELTGVHRIPLAVPQISNQPTLTSDEIPF